MKNNLRLSHKYRSVFLRKLWALLDFIIILIMKDIDTEVMSLENYAREPLF